MSLPVGKRGGVGCDGGEAPGITVGGKEVTGVEVTVSLSIKHILRYYSHAAEKWRLTTCY